MNDLILKDYSCDTIFSGQLKIYQAKKGYRFSIDSLLLANFANPKPNSHIIDLGAGSGVLGLSLAYLARPDNNFVFTFIEKQLSLVRLTKLNCSTFIETRNLKYQVIKQDWELLKGDNLASADYLLLNPPYYKKNSGRLNPITEIRIARHESGNGLKGVLKAAKKLLKPYGLLALVFPAGRLAELVYELSLLKLKVIRMQLCYPNLKTKASLVLLEAVKGYKGEMFIEAPLLINDKLFR